MHFKSMSLELCTGGGGLERRRGEPTKKVDLTVTVIIPNFVHSPTAQRAAVCHASLKECVDPTSVGELIWPSQQQGGPQMPIKGSIEALPALDEVVAN